MLKTISAALLAVSVLAAPALAAGSGKSGHQTFIKTGHVNAHVLNSNARMGRHHVKHFRHHNHRFHRHY